MNSITRGLATRLVSGVTAHSAASTPYAFLGRFPLPATRPLRFSSNLPSRLQTRTSPAPSLPPPTPLRDYFRSQRPFSTSSPRSGIRPYYGQQRGGGRGGQSGWRRKIDGVPNEWILYGIIGLNAAVYGAWTYGGQLAQRYRDASWLRFLNNHFTSSVRNMKEGRFWTLVTCCFSHEGTGHILMNCASLFFMAPPVLAMLGNTGFIALYLFSGVVSSCFSLLFHQVADARPNPYYSSHGASGAVYGVLTFFAASYPRTTFLLFFVVPVPAWLCVSGIVAWDAYSAFNRPGGKTDSAGHIGGAAAGLLWFIRLGGRF